MILKLAGRPFFNTTNQTAFKKMKDHVITMSLIAVAQLFYITYITIIDHFIACGRQDYVLGPTSHCYGVVEINSCDIIHLYYML